MTVPRVMLLTGIAPGRVNIGRLFLRQACLHYPHDSICCFYTRPIPEEERCQHLDWLPTRFEESPPEGQLSLRLLGSRVSRRIRWALERYVEVVQIPRLVKAAVEFGKHHKVQVVWVPLHSPTPIRMARAVAESLGARLITTVWDPPRYKLRQYGKEGHVMERLLDEFEKAIRNSERCGVASESMQRRYEGLYGTPCIPMTYSPLSGAKITAKRKGAGRSSIVIGYAGGGIYARECWDALVEALASSDWNVAGREVMLKVLCTDFKVHTSHPLNIHLAGWRSPSDAISILSDVDVAYLPYWFAPDYQEVVELAFPSKLATYVAAQVPVLYHGPAASSVAAFLGRFPVGIGCHSLDRAEIIKAIEILVQHSEFLSAVAQACEAAYAQELGPHVFRRRFAELLGVSEEELLPAPP